MPKKFSSLVRGEKRKKGENIPGAELESNWGPYYNRPGLKLSFQAYFVLSSSKSPCQGHSQASGKPIKENAGDRILPGLGAVRWVQRAVAGVECS